MKRLIQYQRQLHQIPELSHKEFKTQQFIKKLLSKLDCKVYEIKTGIIAFFNNNRNESIAFRADMDGLPLLEFDNHEIKSKHPFIMHACGHDGHMAILLELAQYLDTHQFDVNLVLIFQHAEEMGGGAQEIVESKILDQFNIKEIYGLHLWPNLDEGIIYSKNDILMAKSQEVDIRIIGKNFHAMSKEYNYDALLWGARFIDRAFEEHALLDNQTILHCGMIKSGTARNIISRETILNYTVRAHSDCNFLVTMQILEKLKDEIEDQSKIKIEIKKGALYPLLKQDEKLYEEILENTKIQILESPVYAAEDFGYYELIAPIFFVFLGIGDQTALHSNDFYFDPTILEKGYLYYLDILKKHLT